MPTLESNFKNNSFDIFPRRFLFAWFLLPLLFVAAARGETVFVANLDGAQNVPANNSAGKGFAVVVLNDAETEVHFVVQFSNLGSSGTFGFLRISEGQSIDPIIAGLSFSGPQGSGNQTNPASFKVTPQQVQTLRGGRWYFTINSTNFPNGEIRGSALPYSPFVANLTGAQVVPPTNSNAGGLALIMLDKAGGQAAIWFGYQNINATNVAGFLDVGMPGTNGAPQFAFLADGDASEDFTLQFLRPWQIGITSNLADSIRRGQTYLRIFDQNNSPSAGEIRGQIKPLGKFADFDGDSRADIGVFRPGTGVWYSIDSANGWFRATQFGTSGDVITPADFDGDGRTDLAVWRQSSGVFYVLRSSDGAFRAQQWGSGLAPFFDKPRVADYDGDGKADYAVFRRGSQTESNYFYILGSNQNDFRAVPWGLGGSSVPGDFDGDRVEDLTVVRGENGQFVYYTRQSSDGSLKVQYWGNPSQHHALSGDFDGDGKTDPVAFTFLGANVGLWWILGSQAGVFNFQWGNSNDDSFNRADFDGDGADDAAVYRSGRTFYIRRSSDNSSLALPFGGGVDVPVTRFPF